MKRNDEDGVNVEKGSERVHTAVDALTWKTLCLVCGKSIITIG